MTDQRMLFPDRPLSDSEYDRLSLPERLTFARAPEASRSDWAREKLFGSHHGHFAGPEGRAAEQRHLSPLPVPGPVPGPILPDALYDKLSVKMRAAYAHMDVSARRSLVNDLRNVDPEDEMLPLHLDRHFRRLV